MQSFKSVPILVLEIWGKRWSKMTFFGIFSGMLGRFSFVFTEKDGLIVIHTCTKFHIQKKSCSRDMGQRGIYLHRINSYDYKNMKAFLFADVICIKKSLSVKCN